MKPAYAVIRRGAALGSLLLCALTGAAQAGPGTERELVVCADPANLPFSNERGEGFENRLAELVARDLEASVRYVWNVTWRASFLRPLRKGVCDVVMGVPDGLSGVAVTRPYYTSTYVFVSARSRGLHLGGFDDPALRDLRLGLHALGAQGANTPPAAALARRGLTGNVTGYPMWGEDPAANPQGKIVAAVASGEIDAAIVWGPIGGYFARPFDNRLALTPIDTASSSPDAPFVYAISIGVREDNTALRTALDRALDRHRPEIRSILDEFGVPLVAPATGSTTALNLQP